MRISKVDILSGGYVELLKKQNQKTNRFFSASVTVPVIGVMLWLMRALKIKKQQKF